MTHLTYHSINSSDLDSDLIWPMKEKINFPMTFFAIDDLEKQSKKMKRLQKIIMKVP